MKKTIGLIMAGFMLALSACAPTKDNNQIPEPAPDHGPEMRLSDCIEPWFAIEVMITPGGTTVLAPGELYASRDIHIEVVGVNAQRVPLEFTDLKTGERSVFSWHPEPDPVRTSPYKPYLACVEDYPSELNFFDITVILPVGEIGDFIRMEVYTDSRMDLNICGDGLQDHAQQEIREGMGHTAVINCLVVI